jgi:hypothetical protein
VFGGTPTTARETPALPIHLSVFLKGRVEGLERISENRKYFGNILEKQPFSENISDYFFGQPARPLPIRRPPVKPGLTQLKIMVLVKMGVKSHANTLR